MHAIEVGPGTPLICVNNQGVEKILTQDAWYTCAEVHEDNPDNTEGCEVCGERLCVARVHLVGKQDWLGPWCFCIERFKPVNDGSTELLRDEEVEDERELLNV